MLFGEKRIQLRSGDEVILKSPAPEDAEQMLVYLKTCASETHYILRYPEECVGTVEEEAKFLENMNHSTTDLMITCMREDKVIGSCQITFNERIKTKHRASVAIGIIQEYWGLGIGTAMFKEMIAIAKARGILQIELDYIEGNERGKALYEKMGFEQVALRPDAIRLKDGTFLDEISMIKKL